MKFITMIAVALTSVSALAYTGPVQVRTHIETYELSKADYASISNEAPVAFLEKVRALLAAQKATLVDIASIETKSGQRTKLENGTTLHHPSAVTDGQVQYEDTFVGGNLEVEPVVGPDGYTIDLNLVYTWTSAAGESEIGTDTHGYKITRPNFTKLSATTSTTIFSGEWHSLFVKTAQDTSHVVVGLVEAKLVNGAGQLR